MGTSSQTCILINSFKKCIGNFLGSSLELELVSGSEEPFPPLVVADIQSVIIILK
jgi:hypothetical protein